MEFTLKEERLLKRMEKCKSKKGIALASMALVVLGSLIIGIRSLVIQPPSMEGFGLGLILLGWILSCYSYQRSLNLCYTVIQKLRQEINM
jgi:hypothetical protein